MLYVIFLNHESKFETSTSFSYVPFIADTFKLVWVIAIKKKREF